MNRLFTSSLATLAAVVLTMTTFATIISVPPAQAQTMTFTTELA